MEKRKNSTSHFFTRHKGLEEAPVEFKGQLYIFTCFDWS